MEIIKVEWTDITHLPRIPDIEYAKEQGCLNFISVGFLIYEDKKMLSIAFSKSNEKEGQAESRDPFREVLNRIVKDVRQKKKNVIFGRVADMTQD